MEICPKNLFEIHPVTHRLWVACRSLENGDGVLEHCEVGCTACARCAMDAPGIVSMRNHLPVVDYSRGAQPRDAIERCPTGAIVWFDEQGGIRKGSAAQQPLRHGTRPAETT